MKRFGFALFLWAATAQADTPNDLMNTAIAAFEPYRGAPLPHNIAIALIAAEDRNFRKRDLWRSTITANAVRALVPLQHNAHKTQIALTTAVARAHTHDTILTAFAEAAYMGNGCTGVTKAAGAYFGKALDDLSPAEAAQLAALIKAPTRLIKALEKHNDRSDFVLKSMAKEPGFAQYSDDKIRLSALSGTNFDRNKRCE